MRYSLYFFALLLSCFPPFAALAAPVEYDLQAGEIRFDGTLASADAGKRTLVLNVKSFTLPNGRSSELATPKAKAALVAGDAKLLSAHDATDIEWDALVPGRTVVVVGKDSGSGQPVTARLVAVSVPVTNPNDAGLLPGESQYAGKITGVLSADTFTIALMTTTDGNGATTELGKPQPRDIQLNDGALLQSRAATPRALTISDLRIGQRVTVIGQMATAPTIKARKVEVSDDDGTQSRSLGVVSVNSQTAQYLNKGDEARRGRAFEEALKNYNQALVAAMNANDSPGQAMTQNRLGLLYDELGQPGRALESYQKSLAIWRHTGNAGSEATTWLNFADHYRDQRDLENASKAIQEAIRLFGNTNARALAIAYSRYGSIQSEQKKLSEAVESWQKALAYARQSQERNEEISVLGSLANAYAALGQPDKAREDAELLIAILPQITDQNQLARSNYVLGIAYKQLRQTPQAKEYLSAAATLWTQLGQRDNAATAQKHLAELGGASSAPKPPANAIVPDN
jgi:tetratricopeptide (TPR) repeat protein